MNNPHEVQHGEMVAAAGADGAGGLLAGWLAAGEDAGAAGAEAQAAGGAADADGADDDGGGQEGGAWRVALAPLVAQVLPGTLLPIRVRCVAQRFPGNQQPHGAYASDAQGRLTFYEVTDGAWQLAETARVPGALVRHLARKYGMDIGRSAHWERETLVQHDQGAWVPVHEHPLWPIWA